MRLSAPPTRVLEAPSGELYVELIQLVLRLSTFLHGKSWAQSPTHSQHHLSDSLLVCGLAEFETVSLAAARVSVYGFNSIILFFKLEESSF